MGGYDLDDFSKDNPEKTISDLAKNPDLFKDPNETYESTPIIDNLDNDMASRTTEDANAVNLTKQYGENFKYCKSLGGWLCWDDIRWEAEETRIMQSYTDMTRKQTREALKELNQARINHAKNKEDGRAKYLLGEAKKFYTFSEKSQSKSMRNNALDLSSTFQENIENDRDVWDKQDYLMNCGNGTIDLKTGELIKSKKSDFMTKKTKTKYIKNAKCPLWDNFIAKVIADKDIARYLQVFVGYCLTGSTEERKMLILFGDGDNGKSVFFNTLNELFGEYSTTIADDLLLKKKNDAHPTEMTDLYGPRLCVNAEISKGAVFDEGRIKRITGGSDKLKARKMHQDFFEFKTNAKLIVATNNLPTIKDMTNSIWNRISPVSFGVTLKDSEKDKKLEKKLEREFEGILQWAVRGCLEWQKEGLVEPEQILKSKSEYREEQDYIGSFLDENIVYSIGNDYSKKDLFNLYEKWAEDIGEQRSNTQHSFTRSVNGRIIPGSTEKMKEKKKTDGRVWTNIIQKSSDELTGKFTRNENGSWDHEPEKDWLNEKS